MSEQKLITALQTLGHTRALKDGIVRLPGFELEFVEFPAIIQAFRRMVRGLEFDVSEMALTTYLCAHAHHKAFVAPPDLPRAWFSSRAPYSITRSSASAVRRTWRDARSE